AIWPFALKSLACSVGILSRSGRGKGCERFTLDFAISCPREPIDENDLARDLIGSEAFGGEGFDGGGVDRCSVVTDYKGANNRNIAADADFGASDLCDAGTCRECGLYFKRRDAI